VPRARQRDEVFELADQHVAVHVPIVARGEADRALSLTISITTFDLPSPSAADQFANVGTDRIPQAL
jgi:hypothetical protein